MHFAGRPRLWLLFALWRDGPSVLGLCLPARAVASKHLGDDGAARHAQIQDGDAERRRSDPRRRLVRLLGHCVVVGARGQLLAWVAPQREPHRTLRRRRQKAGAPRAARLSQLCGRVASYASWREALDHAADCRAAQQCDPCECALMASAADRRRSDGLEPLTRRAARSWPWAAVWHAGRPAFARLCQPRALQPAAQSRSARLRRPHAVQLARWRWRRRRRWLPHLAPPQWPCEPEHNRQIGQRRWRR